MRRVNVDPNVKEPILGSDWLPTKWTCPLYTSTLMYLYPIASDQMIALF